MTTAAHESDVDHAHWADLLDTLEHCATRVPLYKEVAAPRRDLDAEVACRQALARFPILTKDGLRKAFPHKLVPEGVRLADAVKSQEVSFVGTSGTTGERVQVLWHQPWWTAQEQEGFRLNQLTARLVGKPEYREAILTTPVCSGNLCHVGKLTMEARIEDGTMLFLNQTVDPGLWTDADVSRIADELDEFRPKAIECDPAYLAYLAVRLLKLGRNPWQPEFIDHSYEFPSRRHLAAIARVWPVPILDAYGSTECGFAFFQCELGRFHHNVRWSHAEVLDLKKPGLEETGLLLLTTMRNTWLNLVRFDTGDLVRVAREGCSCSTSAEMPTGLVLESLEGRVSDLLVAADGRFVTVRTVDQSLAGVDGLLNYRLRQKAPHDFELDLLPTGLEALDANLAAARLEPVLGVAPRVRTVASLPVEASGKFRLCHATHVDAGKLARGGA